MCRDRSWKVHKLVVCPQSEYLGGLCDSMYVLSNGMTANRWKRMAKSDIWRNSDDSFMHLDNEDGPVVIDILLKYFYTFDYDDLTEGTGAVTPLLLNMDVILAS